MARTVAPWRIRPRKPVRIGRQSGVLHAKSRAILMAVMAMIAQVHDHRAQPFTEDDFPVADGRSEEKLDGAGAFFFREEAHGDQRDQEEADDAGVAEQGGDDEIVDVHGLLCPPICWDAHADEVGGGAVEHEAE